MCRINKFLYVYVYILIYKIINSNRNIYTEMSCVWVYMKVLNICTCMFINKGNYICLYVYTNNIYVCVSRSVNVCGYL